MLFLISHRSFEYWTIRMLPAPVMLATISGVKQRLSERIRARSSFSKGEPMIRRADVEEEYKIDATGESVT